MITDKTVRSSEFGVRSGRLKGMGVILALVLCLALPVLAGNNPYPKTGSETDRELIGKHEKAINYLYDNVQVSGQAVLGADYTITASDAWEDTGLSIALPAAGTYLIGGHISGAGESSAGVTGSIKARLYDSTAGAGISASVRRCVYVGVTGEVRVGNASYSMIVAVTQASTVKLQGWRDASATWTSSQILSGGGGYSNLSYVRIK